MIIYTLRFTIVPIYLQSHTLKYLVSHLHNRATTQTHTPTFTQIQANPQSSPCKSVTHAPPLWCHRQTHKPHGSYSTNPRLPWFWLHTQQPIRAHQKSTNTITIQNPKHQIQHKSTIHGHIHKRLPADPKTPLLLCHRFESHTRVHTTSNTTPTTLTRVRTKPMTHKWFHINHLPTRVHPKINPHHP